MADESKSSGGTVAAVAAAAASLAHTPLPYLVGMALLLTGSRWDGHLHDPKNCFQLQEMKGIVYKIDTCTGKTEEMKPEQASTVK